MRRTLTAVSLVVMLVFGLAVSGLASSSLFGCDGSHSAAAQQADTRLYECPMLCVAPGDTHPYHHTGPGDCVVCGMHLVPAAVQPRPTKR
jgi:hypothetical protein